MVNLWPSLSKFYEQTKLNEAARKRTLHNLHEEP
jgi:hypothetical protein